MKKRSARQAAPRGAVNWPAVEADYITSVLSLREVAQRAGIARAKVCALSSRGGWVAKRLAHQREIAARRLALNVRDEARNEAEIDREVHAAAHESITRLREVLRSETDPRRINAGLEALERSWRLMRITANLPAEKAPGAAGAEPYVLEVRDHTGRTLLELPDGRTIPLAEPPVPPDREPEPVPVGSDAAEAPVRRVGEREDADGG